MSFIKVREWLQLAVLRLFKELHAFWASNAVQFFPLALLLKSYSRKHLNADAKAGSNVALLDFPQAMAYALIAGLPPISGVWSSAVASTIGPCFSSSRFVMFGPTNATAVLVFSSCMLLPPEANRLEAAGVLAFLVGVFLLIGAFTGIAGLLQFVSGTVITAYITAAACQIIVNQIHAALGYELFGAVTFFDSMIATLKGLPGLDWPSLGLSGVTVSLYFFLQKHYSLLPNVALSLLLVSLLNTLLVFLSPGWGVPVLADAPLGNIPLRLPDLSWVTLSQLASPALAIALLAAVESVSIAKSLAARAGDRLQTDQQLYGLGIANLGCSLFSAMPVSGSLTRSILNFSSGAKSAVASICSGLLLLFGVLLMGPLLHFIPKPALASLVVLLGISLINFRQIRVCWNATHSDRLTFLITFVGGLLFKLDFAIYLGVAASIILFLRKASTPHLVEYAFNEEGNLRELSETDLDPDPHISIIHVEGDLFFGSSELFRDHIRRICSDPNLKVVILRLKNARHLDATTVMALDELIHFLRENGRHLLISGAMKDVYRVLKNSGLVETLGRDNIFLGTAQNPNVATRNALKRAKELLGGQSAEVRIYYDPAKKAV